MLPFNGFSDGRWGSVIIDPDKRDGGAANQCFVAAVEAVLACFQIQGDGGIAQLSHLAVNTQVVSGFQRFNEHQLPYPHRHHIGGIAILGGKGCGGFVEPGHEHSTEEISVNADIAAHDDSFSEQLHKDDLEMICFVS